MAAVFTSYTDIIDVLTNATMNVETATLVGGNDTLASPSIAGATSLTAHSGQAFGASAFELWILDGPNSERIRGCTYSGSVITVPAPGTTYAHAANVSLSSPGTQGCLASIVCDASAIMERICRQGQDTKSRSLWSAAFSEVYSGPSQYSARIDRDYNLTIPTYHFPVATVSSVSIQFGAQTAISLSLTYLQLANSGREIWIPQAAPLGAVSQVYVPLYWPRSVRFAVTVGYTGGPVVGTTLDSVPSDVREACHLLVQDRLGRRKNTPGASSVTLGDSTYDFVARGDTSGTSLLYKAAESLLEPYTRGLF